MIGTESQSKDQVVEELCRDLEAVLGGFMGVTRAAEYCGYDRRHVLELVEKGKIRAVKVEGRWLIPTVGLETWRWGEGRTGRRGRPMGSKNPGPE